MWADQSETRRSRSHGSSLQNRCSHVRTKRYASFCIMARGASPLLRWASSRASPLSSTAPRTPASGHALSPLPWIPAVITPLLHRHQNGGWVHPTVRGGRTPRLLFFLLWRLRCRHVVLRYTARQLTSRMAAVDGGDNWPCQDYDSTFTLLRWFAGSISSRVLYFISDSCSDISGRDESRGFILDSYLIPLTIVRAFVSDDDKIVVWYLSREFNRNTTDEIFSMRE